MKLGYARVSSQDQNLARQLEILRKANVHKIFQEKISGTSPNRSQLKLLLKHIQPGDELIVVSLDRLGRDSNQLSTIIEKIRNKNAVLNILDLPSFEGIKDQNLKALLTNLVLEIQKYTAENERKRILERQRQGIESAKLRGVYKGRQVEYSASSKNLKKRKIYEIVVSELLVDQNNPHKKSISDIARKNNLSRSTIYRIKKKLASQNRINNQPHQ